MPTRQKKVQTPSRTAAARPARAAAAPQTPAAPPAHAGIGAVRVYLSSGELARLHQVAAERGQSPSGILRQAFREFIGYKE